MNSVLSCSRLRINAPSIERLRQRLLSRREPSEPTDCCFWRFLWASSPAAFTLKLRQGVMNKANGDRSFTHGGGYALHVTRSNVPDCKNSGQARFQHLWRTGQRPNRGLRCSIQIPPCEDEAFIIEGKATTQPIGSGGGSRHYEHVADFIGRSLSTSVGTPGDTLQVRIAFEIHDFRFEVQFDCGVLFDALDQVA